MALRSEFEKMKKRYEEKKNQSLNENGLKEEDLRQYGGQEWSDLAKRLQSADDLYNNDRISEAVDIYNKACSEVESIITKAKTSIKPPKTIKKRIPPPV